MRDGRAARQRPAKAVESGSTPDRASILSTEVRNAGVLIGLENRDDRNQPCRGGSSPSASANFPKPVVAELDSRHRIETPAIEVRILSSGPLSCQVSSAVEREAYTLRVGGSIPSLGTIFRTLARMVSGHLGKVKPATRVCRAGSNPAASAKWKVNRTGVPGLFAKQIGLLTGAGVRVPRLPPCSLWLLHIKRQVARVFGFLSALPALSLPTHSVAGDERLTDKALRLGVELLRDVSYGDFVDDHFLRLCVVGSCRLRGAGL